MQNYQNGLLAVAAGRAPADVVLTNSRLINVFTGEIEDVDIAVHSQRIAGIGKGYQGKVTIDLEGAYVAPGLIDAHVHIESSLCVPAQFATAVVPRGITAVVTDPHEIGNVAGVAGVEFIANSSKDLPLIVVVNCPSCVPATPMSSTGGSINAVDISRLRTDRTVHGLAEVMNFPGVISGETEMLARIAVMYGKPIDGHCPGLSGQALNAYVAAGVGSDHESISVVEAKEKLSRGLYLLIREATNARNLDALLPVINPANSRRICFCTDDRTPGDLLREGSIDYMVRRAIEFGINPVDAIRMATLNTAEWFNLPQLGAVAPGRLANLFIFDDLNKPIAKSVYAKGIEVARNGKLINPISQNQKIDISGLTGECKINWSKVDFGVRARGEHIRVIGTRNDQLVTDHLKLAAKVVAGFVVADAYSDVLKMAVIERHKAAGKMGLGFIKGFGMRRGAIAGTVAHDHHNLVVIGADDISMMTAARAVAEMGGGLAVACDDDVITRLPLPIGGLMSDRPVEEVARGYDMAVAAAQGLGAQLNDPFMAMSFMALEVIPSLKLTDQGLVDVEQFKFVDLFV